MEKTVKLKNLVRNDKGATIVIVLLLLALLTLVGIASTTFTRTELRTATNDMRSKIAFYTADGATEMASELLEQNISCPSGFSAGDIGSVVVSDLDFWLNTSASEPTDADRDLYFPNGYGSGPHTNLKIGGETVVAPGASLHMAAGYEGKGKSSAGGGSFLLYEIRSKHEGPLNSSSLVTVQWRHVVGQEGDCLY